MDDPTTVGDVEANRKEENSATVRGRVSQVKMGDQRITWTLENMNCLDIFLDRILNEPERWDTLSSDEKYFFAYKTNFPPESTLEWLGKSDIGKYVFC